jgi:hypothetical protein
VHPLIGCIAAVNFKIIFESMIEPKSPVPPVGQKSNGLLLVNAVRTIVQIAKP